MNSSEAVIEAHLHYLEARGADLIEPHRHHIAAVAAALLRKTVISGKELAAIFATEGSS